MSTQSTDQISVTDLHPLDLNKIKAIVGEPSRVTYECAHVYPLSAPNFTKDTAINCKRLDTSIEKLYVHVPFCNYACRFCFYVKQIGASVDQKSRMVHCLIKEMEAIAPRSGLNLIYVGGGTPTALPPDLLNELLSAIVQRANFTPAFSFTIECSPESLKREHLDCFRLHRVNRVSIGVDTLNPDILQAINRKHDRQQALRSCEALLENGTFVNVDLIYGFPGQSMKCFVEDLRELAAIGPHSFTLYNLRLNENTPLIRQLQQHSTPDLKQLIEWRSLIGRVTRELGYSQTRWHTFVKHDSSSNYKRTPCVDGFSKGRQLGVGPSALSHLGYTLYRNTESVQQYIIRLERNQNPVESTFQLESDDQHTLFVARTLGDGQDLIHSEYETAFGHKIEEDFGPVLDQLMSAGLLCNTKETLSLSPTGKLVYDLVMLSFYPAKTKEWLNQRQSLFN
jgi:oxygen-independent coproporphyrinogen III oxidase